MDNPKDNVASKKASTFYVPNVAYLWWARVMRDGARDYGALNWRLSPVHRSVYLEAIDRHRLALVAGEDVDPKSGYPHEAHIMACCSIMLDAAACGTLIDDRYIGDATASLLAEWAEETGYDAARAKAEPKPCPKRSNR